MAFKRTRPYQDCIGHHGLGYCTLDIIHDHVDKRSLELIITSREEWKDDGDTLLLSDIIWFTDGSQTKDGAGIL